VRAALDYAVSERLLRVDGDPADSDAQLIITALPPT